jgi:hypothetical protein
LRPMRRLRLQGRPTSMYTRTLTPGGEIRGQLVPIPAAFYLFASGLIGLVGSAGKWKMR